MQKLLIRLCGLTELVHDALLQGQIVAQDAMRSHIGHTVLNMDTKLSSEEPNEGPIASHAQASNIYFVSG